MIKLLAFILVFIIYSNLHAQTLSKTDSSLIKTYWNKIYPKSIDSKNDYLYSGIDNNLVISYPDEASKKYPILLRTHNGKIFQTDEGWLTIPRNAGRSFITIYLKNDLDTIMIGKKEFTVKNVPYPILKLKDLIIKDSVVINRRIFFGGDSLKLFFTDDLPQSYRWYQIKNFTIGYFYGGVYISVDNDGALFSAKSLELINNIAPGFEMVIKVTGITPAQVLRYLPLIRFKVL